jgi:hypothetical protein
MESLNSAHIAENCPECGAPAVGGRAGCQALYEAVAVTEAGPAGLGPLRDLAFDAYCMQHPETYCRSAKSYAAHLTRLCCGLEADGNPQTYRAIQRWLNGLVPLNKPEVLLTRRGRLTVADLQAAGSSRELQTLARQWAEAVWQAYTPQHELARAWLRQATRQP